MSSAEELEQVAAALDATPELLPYLPELLADLWDLGGSPRLVAEWLGDLGLPPGSTRVLDLGCGKGAVSLTLARDLGFRVHGVDLFEPFILEARERAEEWGLGHRCRFEKGDLRGVAPSAGGYDAVLYASVGALGPLDECVGVLRGCVREGGFLVVDDGFLASGGAVEARLGEFTGYQNLASYEESRRRLTSHGDEILRERILTRDEMRAIDRRYIQSIGARARALAEAHPRDAALILSYEERQKRAAAAWERAAVSAAWLLRKV